MNYSLLFFNISTGEIFIVILVIFTIFGPGKIPEIAKKLGRALYEVKRASSDIKREIEIPIIVKEVGSGISKNTVRKLLEIGVDVIDVSGSGGTSWAAVELMRNPKPENDYFSEWGLKTSYCVKEIAKLKDEYDFTLISSGGINDFVDAAKSLALGSDMFASARMILKTLDQSGVEGVIKLIVNWFAGIKKIMYLTGSTNIVELQQNKILRKKELF